MEKQIRLIDAHERMKWLEDNTEQEDWLLNQYNADWIYSMLECAAVVDASCVVFCKDCIFSEKFDCLLYCEHTKGMSGSLLPDSFCSYGERKNKGG